MDGRHCRDSDEDNGNHFVDLSGVVKGSSVTNSEAEADNRAAYRLGDISTVKREHFGGDANFTGEGMAETGDEVVLINTSLQPYFSNSACVNLLTVTEHCLRIAEPNAIVCGRGE